jgi:rod shape-determining protein MreC
MESFLSRFRNVIVLVIVLSLQTILLATQIKRPRDGQRPEAGTTRLIRLWAVEMFVPVERAFSATGHFFRDTWHGYIDLRSVREQNRQLQDQLDRLRLEQIRLSEDAAQARRLQALFSFKERFISETVAAQVVATSGTEQSRVVYIDKGTNHGLKADMPVITPSGIVGKITRVFSNSSQVLEITDAHSGVGVMLENSRLRGVLNGTSLGYPEINRSIMSDEKIERGERVLTSGGDQIYPRGLAVGVVEQVTQDREGDPFLIIRVKPSSDLNRLEEVLVITRIEERAPHPSESTANLRAADILAQRLPTVTPKPPQETAGGSSRSTANSTGASKAPKAPANPAGNSGKPASAVKAVNGGKPVGDTTPATADAAKKSISSEPEATKTNAASSGDPETKKPKLPPGAGETRTAEPPAKPESTPQDIPK